MKKIKLLSLAIIIALTSACEEKDKLGTNSLIEILEEPAGVNCTNGGSRIITGVDLNDNAILDENEVQNSSYICNGKDAVNTLLEIIPEPAGENCSFGGFKVLTGIDFNYNGTLDEDEVDNTEYICNGDDGMNTLLDIIPEPAGENCPAGGYLIISGLDRDNDYYLDSNEIQNWEYICNGEEGDDFYMFCASIPSDWSCQIYIDSFDKLPVINIVGGYLENPLAVIAYSNDSIGCTDNKSLLLYVYDISKKDFIEGKISESGALSSCTPMFFGENNRYYIITSPCFRFNGCWTDENLEPLYHSIKGLFTSSIIDD